MKKTFLYIILMVITLTVFGQNIYVVTKTTDPNPFKDPYNFVDSLCDPDMYGTLQWAIRKSNDDKAASVIHFNIPGNGPHEILLKDYLPQIKQPVTIDAETQPGYTAGNPVIILNGQNGVKTGFDAYKALTTIRGVHIKNFINNGINLYQSAYSRVMNCVITSVVNNENSKIPAIGIKVSSNYVSISGNTIMTREGTSGSLAPTYGIYFQDANYCTVGGTKPGDANVISECGNAGIVISTCSNNKICRNTIYDNDLAIQMIPVANGGILPPAITSYNNGILSGTALPNSTVEIFRSTGVENTNEYLVSTVADSHGEWSVGVSIGLDYLIALQCDLNNNTSALSNILKGLTCETAIYEEVDNQYILKKGSFNGNNELWFKIIPNENFVSFDIKYDLSLINNIEEISLYSGICNNLQLLETTDSLVLAYDSFQPDSTYYFRITQTGSMSDSLNFYLNYKILFTECETNNDDCYLVNNGDFQINTDYEFNDPTGLMDLNAFQYLRVNGWGAISNSPDIIRSSTTSSQYFARMYAAQYILSPESEWSEGIVTCLDPTIEAGKQYLLTYDIKNEGNQAQNYDFISLLSNHTTYANHYVPFIPYTQNTPVFSSGGTEEIDRLSNICFQNWSKRATCFEAQDSWDMLFLLPYSNGSSAPSGMFTLLDNVQIVPLEPIITTNGEQSINLSCGESANISITCEGEIASLGISPTYIWTTSTGGTLTGLNQTVQPLVTTSYFLEISYFDEASGQNTSCVCSPLTIYVDPGFTFDISATNSCPDMSTGIITVVSEATLICQWSDGINTIPGNSTTLSGLTEGIYYVTATDIATGCWSTGSVEVSLFQAPVVTIVPGNDGIVCNQEPITLDAGSGWVSYHWNAGETTQQIITTNHDTDFSVTVTDNNGCEGYASIHTTGSNMGIKNVLIVHTCEGSNTGSISIVVAGGDAPVSYFWTGPGTFTATTEDISNLFAGIYSVTITDANECEITAQFEVLSGEIPQLTATGSHVCNGAATGEAGVTINNPSGTYTYLWSNAATTPEITDQLPGDYYVTVTDQAGCSAVAEAIIEDYTVNAEFSFNDDCLDLDRIANSYFDLHFNFEYNAIDWQNYDFHWDLGNGTTSTDLSVPVDYALDGYYCVSAVVSREECFSTSSETVYVYPSRCFCMETTFDPGFYDDYTVSTSGEDWIGIQKKIRGQVIVPNGATLYIHKCLLRFGTTGGITVEPGGKLIVSQTEMTSMESGSCNGMWQGIEVHGQWGLTIEQQGYVRFINGGNIIENAHIGVLLGKRNIDYVCNPHINPELGPFDVSGSCGWIKAEDVDFVNNGTDIRFVKPALNYTYQNPSAVVNCDFTCTTLLDACYLSTHPSHYGNSVSTTGTAIIANTRNPWAGGSNPYQRSPQSIWMQKQKFATSFDKDSIINKQNCIETYDSRYNIYRSYFESAVYGIRIYNTLSTATNSHRIFQNSFDKIPGTTSTIGAGVFITGGIFDRIRDNQFGFTLSDQNISNTGVQIAGASRFVVEENDFYNLKNGVLAGNTGNQSSDIRAGTSDMHMNWRGNNFQRCKTNIYTRGNNPRLRLKCNNCENDLLSMYFVNFHNQGVLANQGTYSSTTPLQTWGAGNEFTDGNDLNPSPASRYIKSDYTYGYVYHSNLKTTPVVYPGTVLNLQGLGIAKAVNSIACVTLELPFPFPFTNGIPAIGDIIPIRSDILNNIDSLKQVYSDIKDIEDGGLTLQLLADISNQINDTVLRNELIANSPLSDTVITSLLIEYPLLHDSFISVMLLNMPVSKAVEPYLFARMETLPQSVTQQLTPLHSYNPVVNTATSVTRVIDYLTQERELLVNEILMIFTDSAYYNSDYVKQILAAENNPEFDKNLAAVLIDEGDYTGAQQIIDSIVPVDKETSDWIDYHEILLSLYQDNKTIYQMDSSQLAFVTEMAYKCPEDYTSANAQAVLHLLYGTEFEDCVEMSSRRSSSLVKDVVFKEPENKAWFTDNFPDPFSDETSVNYYLPYGSTGSIVVNDMYGRVTAVFDLPAGENTLVVKSDRLAPGVYSYGFIVDGKSMGHKKMIITK